MAQIAAGKNVNSTGMKIKRAVRRIFSNRTEKVNRTKAGNAVIFFFMACFGLYSILPLFLTVCQAFKPLNEFFLFPPRYIPRNPTMENFKMLFSLMSSTWVPFSRYVFNTILITLLGTIGHILVASMAAYPLAKHKFPGSKMIFSFVVTSLMFHSTVTDVVNYMTMSTLRWIDTYAAIIIPAFSSTMGVFLMRQFMTQIPDSLIESAKIDGASEYRTFWSIIMPQVKPAWLTLAILKFQDLWGVTGGNYIYSEELKTLPYAMNQIVAGGIIRAGASAAATVILMTVPIVFFVFSQTQILQTMATSGMKE